MRLLVLTNSTDPSSGWGMYSFSLVSALREGGVLVTVLTSDRASEGPRLPSVHEGIGAWCVGACFFWMWLYRHRSSFDAVHVFAEPYARFSRLFGKPFFLTVHGTYADPAAHGPKWVRVLFADALRRAARIISISRFTASRLPSALVRDACVIHNGVDLNLRDESYKLPSVTHHPLVLSVGAVKPRKGFDFLIRGFEIFLRKHPQAQLVLVGQVVDQEECDRLRALVVHLGIESSVLFAGRVDHEELLGWYRACDVFALTPVEKGGFEGFGLVYLEAGLFGKPCMGSLGSGAGEAIEEGVTGYLAEATEPEQVAEALVKSLALDSQKIMERTLEKGWEKRGFEYLKLYKGLF